MSDAEDGSARGQAVSQASNGFNSPNKKKKKKKSVEIARDYCFDISLVESTNEKFTEVSFRALVVQEEEERARRKATSLSSGAGSSNGLDPHASDDEEQLAALAARYESKYAEATTPKKAAKKRKMVEYDDIGEGYDEEDPFIDNSECFDERVPEEVTTAHGGFYINTGSLEFKTNDSVRYEPSSDEASQQGEVRVKGKPGPKPGMMRKKVEVKLKKAKMINTDVKTGVKKARIINTEKRKPGPKPKVAAGPVPVQAGPVPESAEDNAKKAVAEPEEKSAPKPPEIVDLESQLEALAKGSSERSKADYLGVKITKVTKDPAASSSSKPVVAETPAPAAAKPAGPLPAKPAAAGKPAAEAEKPFGCPHCPTIAYHDKKGLYQHMYRKHPKSGQGEDSQDSSSGAASPVIAALPDLKVTAVKPQKVQPAKPPLPAAALATASPKAKVVPPPKPAPPVKASLPPPKPSPAPKAATPQKLPAAATTSPPKAGWQNQVTFSSAADPPAAHPSPSLPSVSLTRAEAGPHPPAARAAATLTRAASPPAAPQALDFSTGRAPQAAASMFHHDPRNILASAPSDVTSILGITAPHFQAKLAPAPSSPQKKPPPATNGAAQFQQVSSTYGAKPKEQVLSPDITNSLLEFAQNMNQSLQQQQQHGSPQRAQQQQRLSQSPVQQRPAQASPQQQRPAQASPQQQRPAQASPQQRPAQASPQQRLPQGGQVGSRLVGGQQTPSRPANTSQQMMPAQQQPKASPLQQQLSQSQQQMLLSQQQQQPKSSPVQLPRASAIQSPPSQQQSRLAMAPSQQAASPQHSRQSPQQRMTEQQQLYQQQQQGLLLQQQQALSQQKKSSGYDISNLLTPQSAMVQAGLGSGVVTSTANGLTAQQQQQQQQMHLMQQQQQQRQLMQQQLLQQNYFGQ